MAKKKTQSAFFCQSCGTQSPKWLGKCPQCNEWNTFVEEVISKEEKTTSWNGKSQVNTPILVKDISGVLAKITSELNEEGVSIKTILQTPDNKISHEQIPIIIVTHETTKKHLKNVLTKIEKLDIVLEGITVITIDNSIK